MFIRQHTWMQTQKQCHFTSLETPTMAILKRILRKNKLKTSDKFNIFKGAWSFKDTDRENSKGIKSLSSFNVVGCATEMSWLHS